MLVKKIDPDWFPAERPFMEVGDVIEMDNVETLLRLGQVEIADRKPEAKTKTPKPAPIAAKEKAEAEKPKTNKEAECAKCGNTFTKKHHMNRYCDDCKN